MSDLFEGGREYLGVGPVVISDNDEYSGSVGVAVSGILEFCFCFFLVTVSCSGFTN